MTNKEIFKKAFIKSIPVLIGYLFLGMAYGLLMHQAGFNFLWTGLFSLALYAGSLQFALVNLITNHTAIYIIAFTCLLINFRHIFYGLSFIDDFKKIKKGKLYLIFALTDETYSVLVSVKKDLDLNNKEDQKLIFLISIFNHSYWIIGSILGTILGTLLPFDFNGVDFAMTALFIVILLDLILHNKAKGISSILPTIFGITTSLIFLFTIGKDNFLIPTIIITIVLIIIKNLILNYHQKGEIND